MSPEEFKKYYKNPTNTEITALNIAAQLFCHPPAIKIAQLHVPSIHKQEHLKHSS